MQLLTRGVDPGNISNKHALRWRPPQPAQPLQAAAASPPRAHPLACRLIRRSGAPGRELTVYADCTPAPVPRATGPFPSLAVLDRRPLGPCPLGPGRSRAPRGRWMARPDPEVVAGVRAVRRPRQYILRLRRWFRCFGRSVISPDAIYRPTRTDQKRVRRYP